MNKNVLDLIAQLRSPDYKKQAEAAEVLGEIADKAAEEALLKCFSAETYSLISQEGNPDRYYTIISSAAKALAKLNTDKAYHALVKKVRDNERSDQLGVAAAVYGLTFSPRPGTGHILQAIKPRIDADCGQYLADEIKKALSKLAKT